MPVLDHLRELRRRVIIIVVIIAIGAVAGWFLYPRILSLLEDPYCQIPPQYRFVSGGKGSPKCALIYHGALDGFTIRLKVAAITGAVLTAPFWLYQVWAFITPGLRKKERKYTIGFVTVSTILFAAGASLAYLMLYKGLPILIRQSGSGTQAQLTVTDYIGFVTLMLVVFGAAFELPLIILMANFVGVLPAKLLRKSQRIAIFLIFLFAAIATPTTDPFTMTAMAVPMVLLFEGAVLGATIHDKRKAKRKEAERAASHIEDDVASQVDPIPAQLEASRWSDTT